ncbi:MAG: hypothetical protein V4543_11580, partial [Bacteroidota bacterium]
SGLLAPSVIVEPAELVFTGQKFTSVADAPEINALVLRNTATGKLLVILTAEVFSVSLLLRNRITEKVKHIADLDKSNFLFFSSHTHFCPNPDETKPVAAPLSQSFADIIVEAAGKLLISLLAEPGTPVSMQYAEDKLNHSINRRRKVATFSKGHLTRIVRFLPNPKGYHDESLRMLKFCDKAGKTLALAWNYASHPVCFPKAQTVSADFPGIVRKELRNKYGKETPVVFMPAFSGNVRPDIRDVTLSKTARLRQVLYGRVFGKATQSGYEQWAGSLAKAVSAAFDKPFKEEHFKGIIGTANLPLDDLLDQSNPGKNLGIQFLRLSENILIPAISAEVMGEYTELFKAKYPGHTILPLGYTDFMFGYLPTDAMLPDKGYEVDEWQRLFNIKGNFKPGTEAKVMQAAEKAARNAGM